MPASYASVYVHLVWSTRYREPLISPVWSSDLYAFIGGILRQRRMKLLAVGGVEDHIHLLCSLDRGIAISDLARAIKANSSHWVRENQVPRFHWQDGYGCFSVSYSNLASVEHYITHQREHHHAQSYEAEMRRFFTACSMEVEDGFFEVPG